jgi:hypothetical protein
MVGRKLRPSWYVVLVIAAVVGVPGWSQPGKVFADEASCGDHGTTVIFADSPAEAAKQALKEEKLVFVLHVSGNFETPEYT